MPVHAPQQNRSIRAPDLARRRRNRRRVTAQPGQRPPAARQDGKRLLDLAIAAPLLVALAPLMLLIALLVRLDSPGPALFRQTRTGWRGAPFTIFKFRTMRMAACWPAPAAIGVSGPPDSFQASLRRIQTANAAPGVTRTGRLLRASSLDELPQLLNVLRGEMSLVGPRPHMPELDALFRPRLPHIDRRYAVRPGMTGLAQIGGARGPTPDVAAMAARLEKDLAYMRGWSLRRDLAILAMTPWRLLVPGGAATVVAATAGAARRRAARSGALISGGGFSAARRARTTHMAPTPLHRERMRRRAGRA